MLTVLVIQEALHTTMAQAQQYQHFNMQAQPQQNTLPAQPQNTFLGGNYTTHPQGHAQSHQQEPWNGQGPSRFGMVPQSGHVMFDPISDPTLYTDFANNDINFWTANFTDPNLLVSPSEPMVPPQDMMFGLTTQHRGSQGSFIQSPVEFRFNGALQPPNQPSFVQPSFVNYDASSALITDNYIVPNQLVPTSPSVSSVGQYPQPFYQPVLSPQP